MWRSTYAPFMSLARGANLGQLGHGLTQRRLNAQLSPRFSALAQRLQRVQSWTVGSAQREPTPNGGYSMLGYAIAFFIVALVAAFFGFGSIAAGAAGIAKILFFIFLALAIVSLVSGMMRGGRRSVL